MSAFEYVVDIVLAPDKALANINTRRALAAGLLAFAFVFVLGSALQRSALHNVEYAAMSQAYGGSGQLSPQSRSEISKVTTNAPLSKDAAQWALQFGFFLVGLLLAAVLVNGAAMLFDGRVGFGNAFTALVLIAVPAIGLYEITTGLITMVVGSDQYTSYDALAGAVPNLAWFVKGNAGVQAAFASINPFTIWALFLYREMFRKTIALNGRLATVCAAALCACGVLLQGLLGAVST